MSFLLKQLGTQFKILAQNKVAALAAIKKMPGMERNRDLDLKNPFSQIETVKDESRVVGYHYFFEEADVLEEALFWWNWVPVVGSSGNIISLTLLEENESGDYDLLFKQIAPWVESGSYLEMINEDGYLYRFDFNDGLMKVRTVRHLEDNGSIFEKSFWKGMPVKTALFHVIGKTSLKVVNARTGRKTIRFLPEEVALQTAVYLLNGDVLVFASKDGVIYIYRAAMDGIPRLYFVGVI